MKKYIFTESQIKKIINNQVNEQYGHDGSAGDVEVFQYSLNKYFKAKNIRGLWDGFSFKLNPAASDRIGWTNKFCKIFI